MLLDQARFRLRSTAGRCVFLLQHDQAQVYSTRTARQLCSGRSQSRNRAVRDRFRLTALRWRRSTSTKCTDAGSLGPYTCGGMSWTTTPNFSTNGPPSPEHCPKAFSELAPLGGQAPLVKMLLDLARFRLRFTARCCVFLVLHDQMQVYNTRKARQVSSGGVDPRQRSVKRRNRSLTAL